MVGLVMLQAMSPDITMMAMTLATLCAREVFFIGMVVVGGGEKLKILFVRGLLQRINLLFVPWYESNEPLNDIWFQNEDMVV